eukprot:1058885-Rhodomonas_salina.1
MQTAKQFARQIKREKATRDLSVVYIRESESGGMDFELRTGVKLRDLNSAELVTELEEKLDPDFRARHQDKMPAIRSLFARHSKLMSDTGELKYPKFEIHEQNEHVHPAQV